MTATGSGLSVGDFAAKTKQLDLGEAAKMPEISVGKSPRYQADGAENQVVSEPGDENQVSSSK